MDIAPLPSPALEVLLRDAIARDSSTARRIALLKILLHERYLKREQLIVRVEGLLGRGCFGIKAWEDAFYRDMRIVKAALKAAGYELSYSRRAKRPGYFLRGEPAVSFELSEILRQSSAEVNKAQIDILRGLTPADRFRLGCSIMDAARNAVAYRIRQRHPGMSLAEAAYYALQGENSRE